MEVRHAEPQDYPSIHSLITLPSVLYWTAELPLTPLEQTCKRLGNSTEGSYVLVACEGPSLVGVLKLSIYAGLRQRHTARLTSVVVHPAHQGRGVGSKLLTTALDLADNWLNLRRLELLAYVDNEKAIALYSKHGFVIEGTMRDSAFRAGQYVDAVLMARINHTTPI